MGRVKLYTQKDKSKPEEFVCQGYMPTAEFHGPPVAIIWNNRTFTYSHIIEDTAYHKPTYAYMELLMTKKEEL